MDFSNNSVDMDELPIFEASTPHELSPKYARANLLIDLIGIFIICVVVSAIRYQSFFSIGETFIQWYPVILPVVAGFGLLSGGYVFAASKAKRWFIREQDVAFSSGLIFHKTVIQPILRIQHVELKRGPIERLIGLCTIQIYSAGGALHTFEMPGLELERAQSLRQYILQHSDLTQHG